MKKILLLLIIGFGSFSTFAQDYDDLLNLLVDEDFEKLVYKAEKYTLDDDSKRDAMPYLYLSMGFYEISKISDFDEDYPKAFKDALKYASKYRKKDKNSEFYAEHSEYFDLLRKAAMLEAETFNEKEKYAKSKGYYKYLYSIDPEDAGAWIYTGVIQERLKATREAEEAYLTAKELIEGGCSSLTRIQKEYLKSGLIYYAEYYSEEGRSADAKDLMDLGLKLFGEDKEYKVVYNNL